MIGRIKRSGQHYFWVVLLRVLGKRQYANINPKGILIVNWIFQRIFGINGDVPISVNYTSQIRGFKNIKYSGVKNEESFVNAGWCNFGIAEGTTLTIGEGTIWACNVCIQTANHDLEDRSVYHTKSIVIGKNCWLGNSVTILAGVELGDNVTVGANSVVTKSFPSNVLIAGVPAKEIKRIKS